MPAAGGNLAPRGFCGGVPVNTLAPCPLTPGPVAHWFAVRSKPRQEARAEENLRRQGFEVYFPRIRERRLRAGRWVSQVEPLFPGYLFVRVVPGASNVSPIRSTLGVRGLVAFGHSLKAVPDAVIEFLHSREDLESGYLVAEGPAFDKGDRVSILNGPFTGLTAVFEMKTPGDRAMLLVSLLGRENRLVFDLDQLSPLD